MTQVIAADVIRPGRPGALKLLAIACCLGLLAPMAVADVVHMKDGRTLEGQVLQRDDSVIELDTARYGIRATLRLEAQDVESVDTKPLQADFFDADRQEAKVPSTAPARGGTLYMEVPITGPFGTEVVAEGVRTALAHANLYKIKHVVFVINSTGYSGAGDVQDIYGLLLKSRGKITYHAVVEQCLGDSLVIAGLCNSVHMKPDGRIGGWDQPGSAAASLSPEDAAVFRTQVADMLSQSVVGRPGKEKILRAMLDPTQPLAAWRDASGAIALGDSAPADVPAEQVIFASQPNQPLVLTAAQVESLGVPALGGNVQELGAVLGIPDWRSAGEDGKRFIKTSADTRQARLADPEGKLWERIKENASARESLDRSLERYVREAARLDPTDNSYDTLLARWDTGAEHPLRVSPARGWARVRSARLVGLPC